MKDIKCSDLISNRYLSEIDEVLISTLNLCPPFASGIFIILHLSGALVVHHPKDTSSMLSGTAHALVEHGYIFRFIYDDNQEKILRLFIFSFIEPEDETLLFDFLSNPQRSHHHAADHRTHNSLTECCLSYVLNGRLTHFPGIHDWASKSKRRPWLWRWRKPKGVITDIQKLTWRQKGWVGYAKKLEPFWALVLALNYLPYLLDKATSSGELIGLAKMWSYQYPLLVSLFPRDIKKVGKAVQCYLSRFDRKDQRESEVAVAPVGPPPLSNVLKLKISDRNDLLSCITPPPELSFQPVHIHFKTTRDVSHGETSMVVDTMIPQGCSYLQPSLAHFSA
jgi:hypothetical protein